MNNFKSKLMLLHLLNVKGFFSSSTSESNLLKGEIVLIKLNLNNVVQDLIRLEDLVIYIKAQILSSVNLSHHCSILREL